MKISLEYFSELEKVPNLYIPKIDMSMPLYYFPVLVHEKKRLLNKAKAKCIEVIAWPLNTPIYPIEIESKLLECGYYPGSCPTAEYVARRLIGLPTDLAIRMKDKSRIVHLLKSHCENTEKFMK